jgi:hypothetical protein
MACEYGPIAFGADGLDTASRITASRFTITSLRRP